VDVVVPPCHHIVPGLHEIDCANGMTHWEKSLRHLKASKVIKKNPNYPDKQTTCRVLENNTSKLTWSLSKDFQKGSNSSARTDLISMHLLVRLVTKNPSWRSAEKTTLPI
jgi:hypothetical protein